MTDKVNFNKQETLELHLLAAGMLEARMLPSEIEQKLIQRGLDPEMAAEVMKAVMPERVKLTEQETREAYLFATRKAAANVHPGEIEQKLVRRGVDPKTAAEIVKAVIHEASPQGRRSTATGKMFLGAALFVFGMWGTIGTYLDAEERGGWVHLLWGPIVFGVVEFARGLEELRRSRE